MLRSEQVVSTKSRTTNPFGLAEGRIVGIETESGAAKPTSFPLTVDLSAEKVDLDYQHRLTSLFFVQFEAEQ